MPIYEYRCDACGEQLEKLQRINDDPFRDCPNCGRSSLRRLVSAAGFRLKGSGWYETDFKQGNRRNVLESRKEKGAEESGPKTGKDAAGKDTAGKDTAGKDTAGKDSPPASAKGAA